ncbi:MAG TPA: ABC transporter permease subunit [Chloroflexia bacterium]|nr:ABC transporter permease subunit [Chloroflexia bacterium]
MSTILTIARLTFQEAWRRWMVVIAVLLGIVFLAFYAFGFSLINSDMGGSRLSPFLLLAAYNFFLLAGLYVVHFLTIMLSIFASIDAISGEIGSFTIQALVTKPVRRWEVLMGKWAGYAAMLILYLGALGAGVILITNALAHYMPPNPVESLALILLEALVLLSLSLLAGTRFSTLTNGVALLMFYGLTFVGTWVEQIGAVLQNAGGVPGAATMVRLGSVTSFLLPVEVLWRRAAFLLQPPLASRTNFVSPFAAFSVPDPAMVVYAVVYAAVALGLAIWSFSRRDL